MERRSTRDDNERGSRRSSRDDERGSSRGREESSRDDDRGRDRGRRSTSGAGGFSYKKRSAEDVNKRANQGGKDFDSFMRDDIKAFKVNDGPNTIRILPPTWDDPKHYGIDIWVHYGVGPDQQSYLCLHKMKGEKCPICDELQRARADREDEDYIKNLEPTKRVLFYLIDRDHENEGVMAWAAPWTIDRDITKVSIDRRTGDVLAIDDPQDGYDVEFERTGKGIGTKYVGLAISRRSSDLGKDAWLEFAVENPLTSILEYYSYEHITKAFGGGSPARRESADEGRRGHDDRDSSRSSRDRPDRERTDRDDRGSSRSEDRGRGSSRRDGHELMWEYIHGLEGEGLDALIDDEKLDINPNKFDSDEDLADAICEELKIEKPGRAERSRDRGGDEGGDKLAEMRWRREGGGR